VGFPHFAPFPNLWVPLLCAAAQDPKSLARRSKHQAFVSGWREHFLHAKVGLEAGPSSFASTSCVDRPDSRYHRGAGQLRGGHGGLRQQQGRAGLAPSSRAR
jgi:hypothetical protein